MEEGGGPIEGRSHGRGGSHGVGGYIGGGGGHHGGVPMDGGGPMEGGGPMGGGAPWGGSMGGVPPERHGAYSTNLEKLPMERKQVPTGSRPPSSLMGRQLYRGAQAWGGGTGKRGARGGLCIYKHTAPPYPPPPPIPYQDGRVVRPHGGPEPLQGFVLHGVGVLRAVAPKVIGVAAGPCGGRGSTHRRVSPPPPPNQHP